jgi:Na+-transporting methylmalonyl-CoA/oxaloacetate decarboxylase gamma subunit
VSERELKRRKNSKGQILAEYVTMVVMAFAIVLALLFLLAVFAEYNWRMTALLGWEP